jgi:hypothetical protein
MSMTTLAEESGVKNRETASRIVTRLEAYGIIRAVSHKKGGRGQTTRYQFTFTVNRDSGVTVKGDSNRDSGVTVKKPNTVTRETVNCDSGEGQGSETVTQNAETVTGESHEGFKVQSKEEKKAAPTPKPSPPLFSKGDTGATSRPRIDLSVADKVTKDIIVFAKGINKTASFSGKSKIDLKEAVCAIITADGYASVEDFTRDLYEATQEKIRNCDAFALRNFGSSLAVELVPSIEVKQQSRLRQEQAHADAEYEREEIESHRRFEEAEKQWYIDFELVRNGSTEELEAWANSYPHTPDYGEPKALFKRVYDERKAEELAEKS